MDIQLTCSYFLQLLYVVRCAIWYHLYNFKKVKNTHGGVLTLVELQASACNFTKINTPLRVFFTFFKLYNWYQIAQRITYSISKVQRWTEVSSSIERKICGDEVLNTTKRIKCFEKCYRLVFSSPKNVGTVFLNQPMKIRRGLKLFT